MNCAKRLSWVCQAEQAVGVIEIEVVDLDARALGVIVDELTAGEHAGRVARLATHKLHRRWVGRFDPVGEGVAQVHQRVAEGGQLPVQHADDLHRVVRVKNHVIEAVVVVHDA
jgi:L-alanine-DL-glutamate epimerase-like enolase superfamily enzyme